MAHGEQEVAHGTVFHGHPAEAVHPKAVTVELAVRGLITDPAIFRVLERAVRGFSGPLPAAQGIVDALASEGFDDTGRIPGDEAARKGDRRNVRPFERGDAVPRVIISQLKAGVESLAGLLEKGRGANQAKIHPQVIHRSDATVTAGKQLQGHRSPVIRVQRCVTLDSNPPRTLRR